MRTETRSITIAAPPATVLDYVGDAHTLPSWAPAFASVVAPEGDHWRVNDEFLIDVVVSPGVGTVDIVSAADPRRGVFTRVLANGEGSEYLFTQFFPDGTPEDDIQRQVAVVEGELRSVREACEA